LLSLSLKVLGFFLSWDTFDLQIFLIVFVGAIVILVWIDIKLECLALPPSFDVIVRHVIVRIFSALLFLRNFFRVIERVRSPRVLPTRFWF
jgi:hypothetical protein